MDKRSRNILIGAGALAAIYLIWRWHDQTIAQSSQVGPGTIEAPLSVVPGLTVEPLPARSVPSDQVVSPAGAAVVVQAPASPIIQSPYSKLMSQATAVPPPLIQ